MSEPIRVSRINFAQHINVLGYNSNILTEAMGLIIEVLESGMARIVRDGGTAYVSPAHWTSIEVADNPVNHYDTSSVNIYAETAPAKHFDNNRELVTVAAVSPQDTIPKRGPGRPRKDLLQ